MFYPILLILSLVFPIVARKDEEMGGCCGIILFITFLILWIADSFWFAAAVTFLPAILMNFIYEWSNKPVANNSNINVTEHGNTATIEWKDPAGTDWPIVPRNIPVYDKNDAIKYVTNNYKETKYQFKELPKIRSVKDPGDIEDMLWPFEQFISLIEYRDIDYSMNANGIFFLKLKNQDGTIDATYKNFPPRKDPDGTVHRRADIECHDWKVIYDLVTGDDSKYYWCLKNNQESYMLLPLYGKAVCR